MNANFPVDIVIFAMIAAFLALRLRSVLGRRTGFEQPPRPMGRPGGMPFQRTDKVNSPPADKGIVIEGRAEPVESTIPSRMVPGAETEIGQALAQIKIADPSFDAQRFMMNAERAFCTIVAAYSAGQRDVLRPLLTDSAYDGFVSAIDARELAGETLRCELRRVHDLSMQSALIREDGTDRVVTIVLRFVSDQINVTYDKSGKPVHGVDAVAEILDLWTFERHLGETSPVWRLAGAAIG